MQRWNGYGEETITYPLSESAKAYFGRIFGSLKPPIDAERDSINIPAPYSFTNSHPLLKSDNETRLRHALGQSFPDLAAKRFGFYSRFPDAVAFPESDQTIRELLIWSRRAGAQVIPFGGGTS